MGTTVMNKYYIVREVCVGKEPQYLRRKGNAMFMSKVDNIYEAEAFSTKEEAEKAYNEHSQNIEVEIVEVHSK